MIGKRGRGKPPLPEAKLRKPVTIMLGPEARVILARAPNRSREVERLLLGNAAAVLHDAEKGE